MATEQKKVCVPLSFQSPNLPSLITSLSPLSKHTQFPVIYDSVYSDSKHKTTSPEMQWHLLASWVTRKHTRSSVA